MRDVAPYRYEGLAYPHTPPERNSQTRHLGERGVSESLIRVRSYKTYLPWGVGHLTWVLAGGYGDTPYIEPWEHPSFGRR